MTTIESIIMERNEALFSLDRKKIEAFLMKFGDEMCVNTPDIIFWAGVYKAICQIQDAPQDKVEAAHAWLSQNGFSIPS